MNRLAKELVRIAKEVEAVRWMSDEDMHHQREDWWLGEINGQKQKDYMRKDEIDIGAEINFPNADDEGDFDSSRTLWRSYDIENDELGRERNDVWMPSDLGKDVAAVLKAFGQMMANKGMKNYVKQFNSPEEFNSWRKAELGV